MALVVTVLLLVGLLLLGIGGLTAVSERIDRIVSRIALVLFRNAIEEYGRYRERRERALQSIHATTTYFVYASKTLLFSALVGIGASLIAVYVLVAVITVLTNAEAALRGALPPSLYFLIPGGGSGVSGLSAVQLFVLLLLSSATFGTLGGGLTYYGRWWWVKSQASRREVLVDESVARTIAFIYALSRSGMVYPEIMRTVADNRKSFGECAEEIGVVVKDMDLFGADLVSALQRIAERTPSEQFADFAENFANVLRTGRNVSEYLREQYDQYQEERVENQERLLELFTALGEGYVAALVAGPLFLLTILLIFGILTGGMLNFLRVIVYGLIPLANVGFVAYLDSVSESLTAYQVPIRHEIPSRSLHVRRVGGDRVKRTDGGLPIDPQREMNRIRLAAHNRFTRYRSVLLDPFETLVEKPVTLLYVTVPIALVFVGVRLWSITRAGALDLRTLDDVFIQATLFLVGTFAVVQEYHSRRLREIESAIPDLLDRLASTNEAGMTFTEALKRIDRSDLGALDDEVSKLLADVEWGARTEKALYRFSSRIESSTIARIVALITNAMTASGNLGPVIRIAADEAREDRRLRRQRKQELFMYVIIIYLSFAVFLGIGVALQQILIPAIPSAEQLGAVGGGSASPVSVSIPIDPVTGAQKDKYTLILYHAAVVQAVLSGFVAGKMGEGSVKDGAKHVTIMLAVAYGLFLVFGG